MLEWRHMEPATATRPHTNGVARPSVSLGDAVCLLGACAWPAEAFWRIIELQEVRRHLPLQGPVLELGCGDGAFTALTGMHVDLAIDAQPQAVARAGTRRETYERVMQLDVRDLRADEVGRFQTIFSNSVLEHVAGLEHVLGSLRELLLPGGQLVVTVPLREMNEHLATTLSAYTRARQAQLEHRNLWTLEGWRESLTSAGFAAVTAATYLDGTSCRYWDRLDLLGAIGHGRYRVAPVAHRAASMLLPSGRKAELKREIGRRLLARALGARGTGDCAAVLIATARA